MLGQLGAACTVVKKPAQLPGLDGLVMPGGESTTLIKLMRAYGLWEAVASFAASGGAVLGTCAGMIIAAREVLNPPQDRLDLIDVTVERNSYGRQAQSFEAFGELLEPGAASRPLEMVFIRAPRIVRLGEQVEPLAYCGGNCVLARSGKVLVASFHPELTADLAVHRLFLASCGR